MLQFSEFGRRISENGSGGTDHGAGGGDDGHRRRACAAASTARPPRSTRSPSNPTLENNGGDVRYETDFRSVYAKVLDGWLGADSAAVLGGDFRAGGAADRVTGRRCHPDRRAGP